MSEIDDLTKSFASKHLSEVTKKRWLYLAEDFLEYLKKNNTTVKKATAQNIKDYLASKSRHSSGNSMRTIFYVLKSFFKAWGRKDLFEDELEDNVPRSIEPERPFFSVDETKLMIETAKRQYEKRKDFYSLRDLVMIFISADTGTRRVQIQRLNRENFTKQQILKIPPAFKGGSWTNRKLRKETISYLEEYLQARKKRLDVFADKPDSPLFIDKSNERISPEAMGWGFSQVKKHAGIEKPGGAFHGLRRSKTTRLHAGGMSETEITEALGWAKGSKEPGIYIQLDQTEVQEKANKADKLMDEEEF